MPTENFNLPTQIAADITRADLLTLIGTNSVRKRQYYVTNAVNNTRKIAVFYRSVNQTTFAAMDVNTGVFGKYFITQDLFFPIVEAASSVITYISLANFPGTGLINTVYIAQDTGIGYTWNGTTYIALASTTVFAANFAALPSTGTVNTLYVTTDNGNSYLWDGTAYVQTSNGTGTAMFIPLAGTESGSPVTGDIESQINQEIFVQSTADIKLAFAFGEEQCFFYYEEISAGVMSEFAVTSGAAYARTSTELDTPTPKTTQLSVTPNKIDISSDVDEFAGLVYGHDYSANFGDRSLVDKAYVESRPKTLYQLSNTNGDTVGVGTTYYALTNPITDSGTQNARFTLMTHGGVLRRQMILFTSNQPSTINSVYTIQKNGIDTTLTLSVPANTVAGSYSFTGDAVSFVQGDRFGIKVVSTGTGTSAVIGAMSSLIENTETF
jgi:hypothetical protein